MDHYNPHIAVKYNPLYTLRIYSFFSLLKWTDYWYRSLRSKTQPDIPADKKIAMIPIF